MRILSINSNVGLQIPRSARSVYFYYKLYNYHVWKLKDNKDNRPFFVNVFHGREVIIKSECKYLVLTITCVVFLVASYALYTRGSRGKVLPPPLQRSLRSRFVFKTNLDRNMAKTCSTYQKMYNISVNSFYECLIPSHPTPVFSVCIKTV